MPEGAAGSEDGEGDEDVSRSYRYEKPELRKAKAVRRERLRPLRAFLREHELYPAIHLSDYDTEVVCLIPNGYGSLRIDLSQPINLDEVLDAIEEGVDVQQRHLDDQAARIEAAWSTLEASRGGRP